ILRPFIPVCVFWKEQIFPKGAAQRVHSRFSARRLFKVKHSAASSTGWDYRVSCFGRTISNQPFTSLLVNFLAVRTCTCTSETHFSRFKQALKSFACSENCIRGSSRGSGHPTSTNGNDFPSKF